MGYAEEIYEKVKSLPEPIAAEVLDFTEFIMARRQQEASTGRETAAVERIRNVQQVFSRYQIDLEHFSFDREEANARR